MRKNKKYQQRPVQPNSIVYRRAKRDGHEDQVKCKSLAYALEAAFYDHAYGMARPVAIIVNGKALTLKQVRKLVEARVHPKATKGRVKRE